MNAGDDRDEVGDLLREGYAADVDRRFAASLLTRLQDGVKPRLGRRRIVGVAIAAGVAIVVGAAAAVYCLRSRRPAPGVVDPPTGEVAPLVVRGRVVKWDAPVATVAVSDVIRGSVNASRVHVDLSEDLAAVRRQIRDRFANSMATAPAEAEVSARAATLFATHLNWAAATGVVLELEPRSQVGRPGRRGRILSWAGVADLPPRDRDCHPAETVINVVAAGWTSPPQPHSRSLLTDEWGMPR